MQVHNHDAKQTLFALNHWREGSDADLGIGNQPKENPDWTFAGNAGLWAVQALARPGPMPVVAASINARRFSVVTPGGMPPAQERIAARSGASASSLHRRANFRGRAFRQNVPRRDVAQEGQPIPAQLANAVRELKMPGL